MAIFQAFLLTASLWKRKSIEIAELRVFPLERFRLFKTNNRDLTERMKNKQLLETALGGKVSV